MGDVSRPQLALYVVAAIALVVVGAKYLRDQGGGSPPPAAGSASPAGVRVERAGGGVVVVDVAGAVRDPGVYRLPASARVDDAVRRAGGARSNADLTGINLAAKVEDGRQYIVPERVGGAAAGGAAASGDGGGAGGAAAGAGGAATGGAAGSGANGGAVPAGQQLNLNTATVEQLDQLQGIGPATAANIVAYREEHGGFGSVEELDQVPGIGPARLAALKELVQV